MVEAPTMSLTALMFCLVFSSESGVIFRSRKAGMTNTTCSGTRPVCTPYTSSTAVNRPSLYGLDAASGIGESWFKVLSICNVAGLGAAVCSAVVLPQPAKHHVRSSKPSQ